MVGGKTKRTVHNSRDKKCAGHGIVTLRKFSVSLRGRHRKGAVNPSGRP